MSQMTPREIVSELDRYIVGQRNAKRAVAIALRNRWRRQQVPDDLRDEIAPKNIIMIGPTGVGKTEISRRLAKLAQAPFVKVEASKFTEVGYVGRDVESIIRDLVELAIGMVREEEKEKVAGAGPRARRGARARPPAAAARRRRAPHRADGRRADADATPRRRATSSAACCATASSTSARSTSRSASRRCRWSRCMTPQGMEDMAFQLKDTFANLFPEQDQEAARDGARGARASSPRRRRASCSTWTR